MSGKNLSSLLKNSVSDFFRNPMLIFLGIVLFLFFFGFSKLGGTIANFFQTTFSNSAWVVFSLVIIFLFGGLISTLLIVYSTNIIEKKQNKVLHSIKKFWLKNSLVLFMFMIFLNLLNLILFAFTKLMIYSSKYFTVLPEVFRLLSILISFIYVAGIVIFFSLTSFFIVIFNLRFFSGIKESAKFVRQEYISSLSITVVFYAIISLINKMNSIYADFINYAIILPFMFLLLTRFVIEFRK